MKVCYKGNVGNHNFIFPRRGRFKNGLSGVFIRRRSRSVGPWESGRGMNIVYMVTEDFIHKTVPSMRSVLRHNPKAKIYLLTEVDEADVPAKVINVKAQKWFDETGVNFKSPYSYINLLKVCYPELLNVNKVIHLDADTIVCDSLEPLWKTDLKGKWVAAVPEYRGKYHPFGPVYYNMGVAVINLQQMRADNIVPEMVEYLNTVKQPFADQDAWNHYGIQDGKMVTVDTRYNENFATGESDNPAIVHYCGRFDWWDNPRVPRRRYLEEYL